jgi:hypothetical protein
MIELIRGTWPELWRPSQDEFNGSPQGLLRADNLRADEQGILTLCRGTKLVSSGPLASGGSFIYSSVMNLQDKLGSAYPINAKVRYVGLANGTLLRNYDPTNKAETGFGLAVFTGGINSFAASNCFGHNLLFSGTQKYKDRGDEQWPLGIPGPTFIGVTSNAPPFVNADDRDGSGNFVRWDTNPVEGTSYNKSADYIQITAALVSGSSLYRSTVQRGILTTTTLNLNTLNTGTGTDEDLFRFAIRLSNTDSFIKVRIEYLLETPVVNIPAPTTQDISNYYWHEWTNRVSEVITPDAEAPDLIPFEATQEELDRLTNSTSGVSFVPSIRSGVNVWSTLQTKRGSFKRVGSDDALSWSTVKGIRVTVFATDAQTSVVNGFQFTGGTLGSLTGNFSYIQVDCRNTGSYVENSLPGTAGSDVTTYASSNLITPNAPNAQANFVRIYRSSDKTDGYYLIKELTRELPTGISNAAAAVFTKATHGLVNGNTIAVRGGTGLWSGINGNFAVTVLSTSTFSIPVNSTSFGTLTGEVSYCNYSAFSDSLSDTEALLQGEDGRLDFGVALPPDNVISVVSPFFERAIYADTRALYLSLPNNPGLIDANRTIEIASEDSEVILFITKVAERAIYVATSKDIYLLAGDATIDAGGDINLSLSSLGIKQAPISSAFAVEDSTLFYLASDGWRYLTGSNSQLLSRELDLLFQGDTRHGLNPFRVLAKNGNTTSAIITRGQLYVSMEQVTTGRCLCVFDFGAKTWRYQRQAVAANNPLQLFVEEDGVILYTTETSGDKYLHQMEIGTLIDETTKWNFLLRTVYDTGGSPKNRKDVFTLKVDMDSGGDSVTLTLRGLRDGNTPLSFTTTATFTGREEKTFGIYSTLGVQKRLQLEISGANVAACRIYNISIAYELRPEQVTTLRVPPSNFGVQGRKRIPEIPMVIDTLGNSVTFTPLLDGVAEPAGTINTSNKTTYNYQFTADKRAIDVGGLLECASGVFEFYELITPREVEVLPDSLKFKRISATNLGTSSRKRINQFAFVIDTKGNNVVFVPSVDGVTFAPQTYNTSRKQTVIYTFATEATGIDIEGTLTASTGDFEYYGPDYNDCVYEKLPALASFMRLSSTNWGSAARKRIRTIPLVIDTKGQNVTYIPTIDGVAYPSAIFNTTEKRTVLYYFDSDAFGIDVGGTLTGSGFEFYGMLQPEVVEVLPVAKRLDQLGPIEFKKLGKLFAFRLRVIPTGSSIVYRVFMQDSLVDSGTLVVTPNVQAMYEVRFPKFIMGQVCRIELQANQEFHRVYGEYQVALSGAETSMKWVKMQ